MKFRSILCSLSLAAIFLVSVATVVQATTIEYTTTDPKGTITMTVNGVDADHNGLLAGNEISSISGNWNPMVGTPFPPPFEINSGVIFTETVINLSDFSLTDIRISSIDGKNSLLVGDDAYRVEFNNTSIHQTDQCCTTTQREVPEPSSFLLMARSTLILYILDLYNTHRKILE